MSAESSYLKKVYVSSTIDDLKKHRAAVIKELEKIQTDPIFMENYVSDDKRPVDKCLADVSRCDIYVGIFAWRYGFIPPGYGKSITELEYRKAADAGKSTLIFLLDEKKDWHHRHFGDAQDQLRINALRNEFKLEKSLKFFTTPKDLANKVIYAIDKLPPKPPEAPKVDKCDPIPPLPKSDKCDRIPILLPQLSGLFKDREDKLGTILHCLRSDDNRLVVIIAPGGYGKTELVTRVLNEIAPRTSIEADDVHGILYIKCAKEEKNILGKIFDGAGEIAGKKDEFEDAYASKMTSTGKLQFFFKELSKVGTVWLVMDNFEDLLDTDDSIKDAEVRDFLEAAAAIKHNVRLIVTSRAIPKFNGSQKIKSIDLEGLPEDYAIDYLKEEGAKCGLDDEDEEVLRAFVKRVHCIPAALVSMIGYLRAHYPGRKLVNILKDDNLFLEFDFHDRNVEKGLKKLISQQIEGLSQDARLALSALSIFSKSTPLEAINYLLPHIKEQDLTAILARLIWNCLIILDNDYYDMQPVIRSCVYERIPESETSDNGKGKDEKAVLPTRSWFHQKAAEFFREKQLKPEEWGTINDLEPQLQEIDHLMRAGQYEKAESVLDSIDYKYLQRWGYHETVIAKREQLIGKLKDIYLNIVNLSYLSLVYMDIGRKYKSLLCLEQALKIVNDNNKGAICANFLYFGTAYANLGETYRAIEYFEQALSIAREDGGSCHERWWLGSLGSAYFNKGETQKAFDYYEQALTLAREIEDKRLKGYQLGSLGSACFKKGDPRKATEYYEQALALAREIGEMKFEGTLLGNFGDAYSVLGETRKAIDYYEQALAIAREIKERSVEGWWLDRLGIVYSNLGETRKAIDYYEQALAITREIKDRNGEVIQLGNLGAAYLALGETRKAIDYYEQALAITREIKDRNGEEYRLGDLGNACADLGETRKAIDYYEQALAIASEVGDRRYEGWWLVGLGKAYGNLGETRKATEYFEQALAIAREIGDRNGEEYRLGDLGNACADLGETRKAIDYYEQALAIARELGNKRGEGWWLGGLGNAYGNLGETHKAIDYYEQALAIAREINDRSEEEYRLGDLGNACADLGEKRKAIDYYEQALAIAREIGDRRYEGWWLGGLGNACADLSETRKAIDYYEQALAIAREIKDRNGEEYRLDDLGNAYGNLGETRKPIDYYEQALAIAREIKDRKGEGIHLGHLGNAYRNLGETRKAIDYYEQALAIAREIKERSVEGWWLDRLGIVYSNLGETRKAIDYYEQALSIAREAGYKRGEVETLGNIGYVCFIEEDFNKSVEYFLQALEIAKNVEDYVQISYVLLNLAYAFHYHSNLSDAEQYYRESLKLEYPLDNCQSAVLLGLLLLEKGKSADAEDSIKRGISICREILEKTPDLFKQLYKLALALLASGDSQASLETYRKALTICSAKGVVKLALIDLNLLERAAPNIEGLANARQMLTDAQT